MSIWSALLAENGSTWYGNVANPTININNECLCGQLKRENNSFPVPVLFAREDLAPRDGFGSSVPCHPAHLHTRAESGAYSRVPLNPPAFLDGVHLYRQPPSYIIEGRSRVSQVAQLRTDGVHCRESTSRGPVVIVLKVARVTGGSYLGNHLDQ